MTDQRKDDLFICRRTVGGGEYEGATCYYIYTPIEPYVSPPVPDDVAEIDAAIEHFEEKYIPSISKKSKRLLKVLINAAKARQNYHDLWIAERNASRPLQPRDLSPPVPDDVAVSIRDKVRQVDYLLGDEISLALTDDLINIIRAASTPSPSTQKMVNVPYTDGTPSREWAVEDVTPSAEVEYWKDKCYTAESDAEIHAQCHDKVFDEKKALEAEVRGLRDDIKTAIAQLHEGNKALAMRALEEVLNQPTNKGENHES